jgi:hypothetical protein
MPKMLRAPSGKPAREATLRDVDRSLDEARMYVASGGSWEHIEEFVNDWLDCRSKLVRAKKPKLAIK